MLLDKLLDPARSADQDIAAFGQFDGLELELPASHCHERTQVEVLGELLKLLLDLFSQFSGWHQHQRIGPFVKVVHVEPFQRDQEVDDRKEVPQSLALSSWSDGH